MLFASDIVKGKFSFLRRGQVVAVVEEEEELPGLPLRPLLRALLLPVVVEPQRRRQEGAPQRILERLERLSS